jgi:1,4-dihydroxy-2-naphthoyl-CoA hydrolase
MDLWLFLSMKWFKNYSLDEIRSWSANTLLDHLDIQLTSIENGQVEGTMPVNRTTHQPHGILHGGASVALAESLGSIGANLLLDPEKAYAVGMEINANHVRPVREGIVTGIAKPLHAGNKTQVWSIEIRDEQKRLVCISRITMAVVHKTNEA